MKIQAGKTQIVVGKRVALGAMIGSVATTFAALFPDYAVAIMGSVTAVTFFVQVAVAHFTSITTKEQ